MVMRAASALLVLFLPMAVLAQPRRVEAVMHTGYMSYESDKGVSGGSAIVGGTVTLPPLRWLAVELDAHTSTIVYEDFRSTRYDARATFYGIAAVFRFGSERLYGFAGTGPGALNHVFGDWTGFWQVRGGGVFNPGGRLLIRAEWVAGVRDYSPVSGVKVGAGVRF